jgi:hypothetical protein
MFIDGFHFLRPELNATLQMLKQVVDIVTTALKMLTL